MARKSQKREPDSDYCHVVVADNGQDYDEYDQWNVSCFKSEAKANAFAKKTNDLTITLYEKAEQAQRRRFDKEDYVDFYETAAGVRLFKHYVKSGIFQKNESIPTNGRITLFVYSVARGEE